MKKAHVIVYACVILLLGFLMGRVTASKEKEGARAEAGDLQSPQQGPKKTRVEERTQSLAKLTSKEKRCAKIRLMAPDKLPEAVFNVLETGDPVIRFELLSALLAGMNAENYQAILDEALRVSKETGRELSEEWLLMNIRAGQVAGLASMERLKAKNGLGSKVASKSFYGWAITDPDAARKWMEQQTDLDPGKRNALLNSFVAGSVISDPLEAGTVFAAMSEDDQNASLIGFTSALIDSAGKEGSIAWLQSVQAARGLDDPFTKSAVTRIFDRLMWSGANRLDAGGMVSDLERLSTVIPINEQMISRGMGQIRDRSVTGGIELLEKVIQSEILLKDQPPLSNKVWGSAVDYAMQRDPDAVRQWLEENPDSPIHEIVLKRSAVGK